MVQISPPLHDMFSTTYLSALMYSRRAEKDRVECVDLDPYGTAAPFIDAAVQCVKDEGEPPPFATTAQNL
jgi:tRNA G26 N,N-dimethylase Trm1